MDEEIEASTGLSNLLSVITLLRGEAQIGTKFFLSPESIPSNIYGTSQMLRYVVYTPALLSTLGSP